MLSPFFTLSDLCVLFQAIIDSPYIAEAAVIGVPDKLKGQVPLGLCVPKHGRSQWIYEYEGFPL